MEKSIDNHIEILKSYHHGFTGCAGNLQDSIDVAVDIMNKYQKIVQIVENVDKRYYGYSTMMDYLHEVVEDGNGK